MRPVRSAGTDRHDRRLDRRPRRRRCRRLPAAAACFGGGGRLSQVGAAADACVLARVTKIYGAGDIAVHALRGVDFARRARRLRRDHGRSGSGKSTLMNIIGCLDVPTHGRYLLDGIDVSQLDEYELAYIRNRKIGFVFQSFNLIPRTTRLRNVELPLIYARVHEGRAARARAMEALAAVGLADRARTCRPSSPAGSSSASAIARAIVTEPGDRARRRADRQPRQRVDAEVLADLRPAQRARAGRS